MTDFPVLYKKTSTGAIQFWHIWTTEIASQGLINTQYGQQGTGSPQSTVDVINIGKNIGKKNETTAAEQAILEAKSKWEKQKKKGYVENVTSAENDEIDDLIEGGIVPMLAQSFSKHAAKIKYPCYGQPKLDGIRCIAILKDGKCTLWSRTRKLITGVPHIARKVEKQFEGYDIILDGELYNHQFKKDFEKIVSFVRQEVPAVGHEVVQYHIYDTVNSQEFQDRIAFLRDFFGNQGAGETLQLVNTYLVGSEDEIPSLFADSVAVGYEGIMLRNAASLYLNKRSSDLQKVKEFEDAEFDIIGVDEGRGKLTGHVGAFVCRTKDGKEFLAKMSGDTGKLKEYFENHALWQGKRLTVKYQGLTGANAVPRFPVGITIRDYE